MTPAFEILQALKRDTDDRGMVRIQMGEVHTLIEEFDRLRTALRRIADHPEPVQAGKLRQIARDGLTPNYK
jgi:hypothetical protein